MKVNNKQIRFFLILVMAIMVLITNQYAVKHYETLTEDVVTQEKEISDELIYLKSQKKLEDTYLEDIMVAESNIIEIISEYGKLQNVTSEIAMIIELENNLEIKIPTVSFGLPSLINSVEHLNISEGSSAYLYRYPISISYRTTYEGIKEMVDYLNESEYRKNIDSISMAYDSSTGVLSGAMVINLYSLDLGTGDYIEAEFEEMAIGVDNIFGTYK